MLGLREVDQLSAPASLPTPEGNAEGPRLSVSSVTRLWTVPVLREILSISRRRRRRRRRSRLALERSVTTSAWIMEDVRSFTKVIWCQVLINIIVNYINGNSQYQVYQRNSKYVCFRSSPGREHRWWLFPLNVRRDLPWDSGRVFSLQHGAALHSGLTKRPTPPLLQEYLRNCKVSQSPTTIHPRLV